MADTRRTWAALAVLYGDNTAGAISPQDLRDGFASVKPRVSDDAPTASDDETLGFDVGHAWIDTSTNPRSVYECVDPSTGAAAWVKRYPQDAGGVESLGDLDDVDTSGVQDGDALVYDADTSTWKPGAGGGGGAAWGGITGTLSDQTDLQDALAAKLGKLGTVNSYAGNRTLDSSDSGAYVRITAAGNVEMPDGQPTGMQAVLANATDSDEVTMSAETTLVIPAGFVAKIQPRRAVTVIHVGSNVWEVHGALVEEEEE